MTPKKKANKLWRDFANADFYTEGKHATYQGVTYSQAVICAIIEVDKINEVLFNLQPKISEDLWLCRELKASTIYWIEVKKELEAMK